MPQHERTRSDRPVDRDRASAFRQRRLQCQQRDARQIEIQPFGHVQRGLVEDQRCTSLCQRGHIQDRDQFRHPRGQLICGQRAQAGIGIARIIVVGVLHRVEIDTGQERLQIDPQLKHHLPIILNRQIGNRWHKFMGQRARPDQPECNG